MGVINLGWLITKLKNKGFLTSSDASAAGFVKDTDYATYQKGGVIKVSSSYGTNVTSAGILFGAPSAAAQYPSMTNNAFIVKGTLENIKGDLVKSVLVSLADSDGTAATGTKWDTLVLEKTADGYTLGFKNTTTP